MGWKAARPLTFGFLRFLFGALLFLHGKETEVVAGGGGGRCCVVVGWRHGEAAERWVVAAMVRSDWYLTLTP